MNPLQPGSLTDNALANRFYAWQQLESAWRSGQAHAAEVLAALRRDCEAAGKNRQAGAAPESAGAGGPRRGGGGPRA